MCAGVAGRFRRRARFAAWISACGAWRIWIGQCASGVCVRRVLAVADQMLDAELMDQVTEDLRVVVLVAVVHDDAGQLGQDERFEGVRAAVAEQVPGVDAGAGHQ